MKKLLLLLALFCSIVPKMSADVIQPSTTPYDPEHVYTMKNANNWYADANTHGTQTAAEYGHFAFYQATNTDGSNIENAYYIYCITSEKWLTYTKASSYSNQRNFITMSSSFAQDDYFYLNQRETGFYDIAPYNTSGVASKYLNWYQGANENHTTIGLWEQNLSEDPGGSKFTFTEVSMTSKEIPYFTITTQKRGSWIVKEDNGVYTFTSTLNAGVSLEKTNPLHQFAFYKENGNTYLYNLGAKQFIGVSGESGSFSYDPQTPIYSMCGTSTGRDNTFILRFSSSKDDFINVIGSGGNYAIKIDDWGPGSASNNSGCDDEGNRLTITKEGTFTFIAPEAPEASEEEDLSETLTPDFCPVDGEGVKVNAFNGTFGEEQYGCYHKWESEKTAKVYEYTDGGERSDKEVPMVTIEAFKDSYKDPAYRFQYPSNNKNITTLILSNTPTFMKLTAGADYKIVGYKFTYTTTQAIKEISGYEGQITCDAAGTHTVTKNGLNDETVEITFGNATGETISISDFYVFVRKGEALTTEFIEYLLGDGTENSGEPGMAFNQAYAIASKKNPNNHLYAPEGKDMLDLCGEGCHNYSDVKVTGSDPYQQFMLIPLAVYGTTKQEGFENCFFLYNVGQRKFVSKEGDFTLLTKYPRNAVEIIAGEGDYEGYFRLNFNKANLLNVSTDFCTDESKSCVVTNNNESGDGNNFYIREVRDFREEYNNQLDEIRIAASYLTDEDTKATLSEKISDVLEHEGVGYPKSKNTLEAVKNDITTDYGSILTCFDLDYYINAYKTTTEVNMPESGNAYRIYARYANGDKRYLYRTEGGKLRMSNANEEPTGHTGTFILRSTDTAENSYLFAHDSGEYMVYVADQKQGVGNSGTGFVSAYEQGDYDADVTLISTANKTATNSSTTTAAGDFFGGFLLQARNTTDNNDFYMMGGDGTDESSINLHDGEASSIYYNDTRSSIFYVEEASYPNVANMRCAAYDSDGKSYASIWLPFDIEIPEGVEAYTARIDEVNSILVLDLVEEDYLPAECAAILIGSTEEKMTLVPAKVKADVISSNQLKGTNVAGQAPATDKKTFVLNGAKTKGIGFYPYTAANLPTYKAYIEMDAEMAAQGLRFSFATPTGIEETIIEGEREAKVYYDLSGRRVAQPTKGLYIVNGKKMYIK